MSEWKHEFGDIEMNDSCTAVTSECSDIIRDESQENEEKLICEDIDITKGNELIVPENTAPLNECSILSTPSTSPSKNEISSPSPPIQVMQRKQKNKKRRFSEMNTGISGGTRNKKQKLIYDYFGDNLDELISTNTDTFFDDHFPHIIQNTNKIRNKDSQSVMIANRQT
ncbi:MAG: hypothetical protein GY938_11380, partial [Ketobacter sp.]|nr:hypothetical protein [Ketobacter sp.]